MEKIKNLTWIIISFLIMLIISGLLLYTSYLKQKTYDYKGVFVIENPIRRENHGYIYTNC